MIEMRGVTVRYGNLTALDSLSLNLPAGEVFGFIGPNGAGKSTTMKVLACLLKPTEGQARVDGLDIRIDAAEIRRIVGYMPDFLGVYDDLTVDEYLQFFASAFSIPRTRRRALIAEVLELTDLTEKRHAMVDSLSRGMQQRLGVARVLVHDPKVLLLDEPASGLDPRARIEMRALLTELRRMGKTIIVSSHILSELAEMCTSIGIIERGRLLYAGRIEEAFAQATRGAGERIVVRLESDSRGFEPVREALTRDARIASVRHDDPAKPELIVELTPMASGADNPAPTTNGSSHGHHFLIQIIINAGYRIDSFTPREQRLEDVFLRLTQGHVQ